MKKILLATVMCAVLSFAGDDSTDLLKLATADNTNGASYELSSNEMQSVKGGQYRNFGPVQDTRLYRQSVGTLDEGYMGNPDAKMYARQMKSGGTPSVWINFVQNGRTFQAFGAEANRLIALYGDTAKGRL